MTARALILRADEVRGVLNGRKTQLRRPLKPQPPQGNGTERWSFCVSSTCRLSIGKHSLRHVTPAGDTFTERGREHTLVSVKQPWKVGGRYYVKEAFWSPNERCDHEYCGGCDVGPLAAVGPCEVDYCATPNCKSTPKLREEQLVQAYNGPCVPGDWDVCPPNDWYEQDDDDWWRRGTWEFSPWRWSTKYSAAIAPKWASRITLEFTSVRIERLHVITEADTADSGCDSRESFAINWDKTYGTGAWAENPWVWVGGFRRLEEHETAELHRDSHGA